VAVIYGVPGGWYYSEYAGDTPSRAIFTVFAYFNRAFLLGFFFLIAAFFTPGAYDRKGPAAFMKDRVIRLGTPLVVYSCLIGPTITYLVRYDVLAGRYTYFENLYRFKNVAPAALWFVEVLLIFSFLYLLWRLCTKPTVPESRTADSFPANSTIMIFALIVGLITFLVRLYYPSTKIVFFLRPGNYPQYIALFVAGVVAYRKNWLAGITDAVGRFWLTTAIFSLLLFIVVMWYDGVLGGHEVLYRGGMTWQGLFNAVWENVFCMGIIIGSLYLGRKYDNRQGRLMRAMSKDAYSVYIFHAPFVVGLTYYMQYVPLYPLLKFCVVAAAAVSLTFVVSHYCIRKIPFAKSIL
jgi:glucans biosynthesis protein C